MEKKAIICVDDEKIVLESLQEQLEKQFGDDYIYEVAESAEEGIEIIEELSQNGVKILIIVSDWLMPGTKGDEFLIKVHERYPGIVKVLLTGQAKEDSIKKAEEKADLFAVLHKPWSGEELYSIINSGLKKNE